MSLSHALGRRVVVAIRPHLWSDMHGAYISLEGLKAVLTALHDGMCQHPVSELRAFCSAVRGTPLQTAVDKYQVAAVAALLVWVQNPLPDDVWEHIRSMIDSALVAAMARRVVVVEIDDDVVQDGTSELDAIVIDDDDDDGAADASPDSGCMVACENDAAHDPFVLRQRSELVAMVHWVSGGWNTCFGKKVAATASPPHGDQIANFR